MTKPVHIMLDLETWGTRPGCDLRSIGACVFDPATGVVAECHDGEGSDHVFYEACDNPILADHPGTGDESPIMMYPLTRDPRTVEWWNDPERAEAAKAFGDPIDLREALNRFSYWLSTLTGTNPFDNNDKWIPINCRLWAHGPSFDVSILEAAYHAVNLPVPWHYRAPRDTRTIMEQAGMDPHKGLEPFNTGTHHNALDDAICQARAVCHAFHVLRVYRNTSMDHDGGLQSTIRNIVRNMEDEGDRVYFGSTNDADDLRIIAGDMQTAWEWSAMEQADRIATDEARAAVIRAALLAHANSVGDAFRSAAYVAVAQGPDAELLALDKLFHTL